MNSQMYQELVKEECIPQLKAANNGSLEGTKFYKFFKIRRHYSSFFMSTVLLSVKKAFFL